MGGGGGGGDLYLSMAPTPMASFRVLHYVAMYSSWWNNHCKHGAGLPRILDEWPPVTYWFIRTPSCPRHDPYTVTFRPFVVLTIPYGECNIAELQTKIHTCNFAWPLSHPPTHLSHNSHTIPLTFWSTDPHTTPSFTFPQVYPPRPTTTFAFYFLTVAHSDQGLCPPPHSPCTAWLLQQETRFNPLPTSPNTHVLKRVMSRVFSEDNSYTRSYSTHV